MRRLILGQSKGRCKSQCRSDIDTGVITADSVINLNWTLDR